MMMTLAERVGQLMMAGFEGLKPPPHILAWLASGRIGGIYLFARNIKSPAQVKRLIADCRAAAKHPILVGIDQEGGIVARLRNGFSESPGAMALGASGDCQLAEDVAFMMGREMAALGINWNFAPVADIAHQRDNPSIGTRAVGRDPRLVSEIDTAQIRGFQRAGLAATVKHFPGLGNSVIDTHGAPARVTGSLSYLYVEDLLPFRAAIAAGVGCVMLTHVIYEALDSELPATLSPRIVDGLLRRELGFDGAVCTDCMEMKAMTDAFGPGESAVRALLAGVDLILFSHSRESQEEAYDAMLNAALSGRISEERIDRSWSRVQALKRRFSLHNAPPLEIIGCEAHRALAHEAARRGVVMVKRGRAVPLNASSRQIVLIEFSSQSSPDAGKTGAQSRFASLLSRRIPRVSCHLVDPTSDFADITKDISGALRKAGTVILVTRNGHRQPAQRRHAQFVCDSARQAILVCAGNPYDAGMIHGADSVICTNGDSGPSLEAAVDAICGDYSPSGKLTVEI
ncbi:MAG: beta-N-acetylhexosaminidase [Chloroflexi bacterium]|nr:beta-N-acetylhexosaminidase [Chloroflexota bacterium]